MSGRDIIGFFNLIIVAAILGGISYAAFMLTPDEYDSETLCLVGATPPHRVVVIDKTDLYSPQQASSIEGVILRERNGLEVGERLSLSSSMKAVSCAIPTASPCVIRVPASRSIRSIATQTVCRRVMRHCSQIRSSVPSPT